LPAGKKKASRTYKCGGAFERAAREAGSRLVAGVDEVGRGCLFGPVFAGAVILDPAKPIRGLNDSKLLDAGRREVLSERIRERAVAWAVGAADCFEIDRINILQAARLAMKRAVEQLHVRPDYLLVDCCSVDLEIAQQSLIKGDARSQSIAAASIVAKVARDAAMMEWDKVFPQYGLAKHKGYYTPEHLAAIGEYGPTWLHRFSFEPVRQRGLFSSEVAEAS
jgi:ribonuclease HII